MIQLPFPAPVLIGLVLLYLPLYQKLSAGLWLSEAHGHGPLIALTSAILLGRLGLRLVSLPPPDRLWPGMLIFSFGLLLSWVGHSQDNALFATASQLPVLAGILLVLHGKAGLRLAAFPLLFLLFMVPLPGIWIDALTLGLKEWISATAVHLLHGAGYPVAHSGVIIVIGQYQMMIADACSGLHSLVTLTALCLLYLHLRPPGRAMDMALMLLAILPAALFANLLRTLVLLLTTYHAGDAVAQAWHGPTGIALFLVVIALLTALDALLARRHLPRRLTW